MEAKLEVESVHKSFGKKVVLAGFDLAVEDNSVACLIGPSGCGKSTVLRCIDLLDPIDAGDIRLGGESITASGVNSNDVRRRIGIVFQSFNLFAHMNVLDNVTLGPRRAHGVDRDVAEDRAAEMLQRFGLGDKVREFPNRLSGGQQQRAAIVRALMSDPELLLLDEVTSALDPELVGEVLGVIRDLADQGMTMVLATHEMGFARDVADQVCFMHEGRTLEAASPEQLFDHPGHARTQQFLKRVRQAGRL